MLCSCNRIEGYRLHATDGDIGKVKDLYFDDTSWVVRYLVADTGKWLSGRQVLLAPAVVEAIDHLVNGISVRLSRQQIEESPPIDADAPVSHQQKARLAGFCRWPSYWNPSSVSAGAGSVMTPLEATDAYAVRDREREPKGDPHLRSVREVVGYSIHALDGTFGHVEDFIIDADHWVISYVIVDTKNWWPGKNVVLLPAQVVGINWATKTVHFDLTREAIKQSQGFDPSKDIGVEEEARLQECGIGA